MTGPGFEADDGKISQKISRMVDDESTFSTLGGTVSIIEAPEEVEDSEYLMATDRGDGMVIWPSEVEDYVRLLRAWKRWCDHEKSATNMEEGVVPDDTDPSEVFTSPIQLGDHNCWEFMEEDFRRGGTKPERDDDEIVQKLSCGECGTDYWRRFTATSVSTDEDVWTA